jgi:hypothetical protein
VTSFETATNTYDLVQRTWVAMPVLVTAGAELLEDGEGEGSGDQGAEAVGNGADRLGVGVGLSGVLAAGMLLGAGFVL